MRTLIFASVAAAVVFSIGNISSSEAHLTVDARTRGEVIERVLEGLERSYVFPEVARQMSAAVRERVRKGDYAAITGAREFAEKLTADLQAISRDKHLRVRFTGAGGEPRLMRGPAMRDAGGDDEGGFARIDILPGNVGYIDLRMFHPPQVAAQRAADAMNRVASADALIIDLRKNSGGNPEMVALLVSYLLEPEPATLVNTFVGRDGRLQNETWTTRDLPGKRFTGKDVYVLTSNFTFSAGEEFAYDLQNLKRATIVGETTGGGANPVDMLRINERFDVSVPVARAVNPITKTNWEGVGVSPDVKVAAELALDTAHLAALRERAANASNGEANPPLRDAIDSVQQRLEQHRGAGATR